MDLLSSENEIAHLGKAGIVLTNFRIIQSSNSKKTANTLDIFLEDISSIEAKYINDYSLLVLAFLSILFELYVILNFEKTLYYIGFIAGIVFFILWWLSRRFSLIVSSNGGGKVSFEIGKIKRIQVEDFIMQVKNAKLKRVNELHGL